MLEVDIHHHSALWPETLESLIFTAASKTLDVASETQDMELSVVLADNDFIQELNKNWREKDKPTNVLSFPQDEPDLLGDIILAYETIADEAQTQDKPFEDHLTHLTVHGILHLLGHDHEEDEDAEIMEGLEIKILEALGIKNPYKT